MLSVELEAALVREIRAAYDWENDARFGKRLRPPVLVLADATSRHGAWVRATRRQIGRASCRERVFKDV